MAGKFKLPPIVMTIMFKLPNHHICLAKSEKLKKKRFHVNLAKNSNILRNLAGNFEIPSGNSKCSSNQQTGKKVVFCTFLKKLISGILSIWEKEWKFTKLPLLQYFTWNESSTVWKFQDFCGTQISREINF